MLKRRGDKRDGGYKLKRHENGRFYIHWTEKGPDGKSRSRHHSTGQIGIEEAELYRAHWLIARGSEAAPGKPLGYSLTVDQALDDYFDEHVRVKAITEKRIEVKVNNLKAFFAGVRVHEIDIPLCRAYAAARRHKTPFPIGRSPAADATIRGELQACLVPAINHAVKWKRLDRSLVPFIEAPEAPPPRQRWLTRDELRSMFEEAKRRDERLYRFVMIAYWTGARRGAIETMKRDQVSLEYGRIYLNPTGRKKTNKRRPTIPIPSEIRPMLEQIFAEEPAPIYILGSKAPIWYAFRKLCDALGLKDVVPHTLRHTRATHMMQDGKDPWAVAGLLGDNLQTIVDTYGHHCPDHLRDAI